MKAKIQFTVDIEEIPEEVRLRTERVLYMSQKASEDIKEALKDVSENNIISATQKIDKIRKNLTFIDSVLEDGYNVLVGYANYQTKQLESSIPQSEEPKNE